jgi:Tol biopolymer transport system component
LIFQDNYQYPMVIRKIIRSRCCFFKLSTVFAVVALALLFVTLVSFPVHAERWSQPIQVTFDMNIAYSWGGPSMSSDGSRIVFQHKVDGYYEVFVVNTDGTGLTQVTTNQRHYVHLSISGDGSKIAVSSYMPTTQGSFSDPKTFVVNSDGTGLITLISGSSLGEAPVISDDGSKVVITAFVDSNYEVFVVNSDGTGLKQLSDSTSYSSHPSISSDGSKVAFMSNSTLIVVNSDGTGLTPLTNSTMDIADPAISGDGSKVVFISHVSSDDSDDFDIPNSEVFVVNTDGTGLTQVTNTTANEAKPSINYDGSKIAFSAYTPEQNSEVFVVNSDGTGVQQITQSSKMDYYPSISGDGKKISFISFEGNINGEIFVSVDLDQDSNAPITTDNYGDLWHMVDFQINLTATDDLSGVTETYYKINGGSVNTVSAHGQPFITEESANNTLEYWSVDAAGNEETHTILREIKLDKTAPTGSVIINNEDNSTASTSVTLTLSANDTSGAAQMRFSDNETYWTSWETYTTSKNWTLPSGDGEKTVYVQFKDTAGWVSGSYSATILLETPKEAPFPTTTYVVAGITSFVIAAAVLLYLKKIKFAKNNRHT